MQRLSFLLIASLSCFALGSCKDVRLGVDGVDAGGAGRGGGGGAAGAGGTTSSTAGTTGTGGATSSAAGTTGTEGATSSAGGTTITGGTASSTGGTTSLTGGTTITGGSTRATGGTTITGGSTFTTLASGLNSPSSLVVDATNVYFINGGTAANNYADGTLMKVPIAGGKTTTIASGQRSTTAIAVAGTNLYWTHVQHLVMWSCPPDSREIRAFCAWQLHIVSGQPQVRAPPTSRGRRCWNATWRVRRRLRSALPLSRLCVWFRDRRWRSDLWSQRSRGLASG